MQHALPCWGILAILAVASGTTGAAQLPERSAIYGIVLVKGSDQEPVAGAWAILEKSDAPKSFSNPYSSVPLTPSATTDHEGRFQILDIPPGSYRLTILRNGYARQIYGQRVEDGNVPPIELTADEKKNIVIQLAPAGNISGTIRSPTGQLLSGQRVQLLRRSSLATVAGTRTNDRGEFRFYWVTPGSYYVQAGGDPVVDMYTPIENHDELARSGNNEVRLGFVRGGPGYARAYYPGVRDIENATVIDVHPREERRDVHLTLQPWRNFRIHARVTDSRTGRPPLEGTAFDHRTAWSFDFDDGLVGDEFQPGTYWIGFSADVRGSKPRTAAGSAKVVVTDSDVEFGLTLLPPSVVKGHVAVDESAPSSINLDSVSFKAFGDGPSGGIAESVFFSTATADKDGSFTLHAVPDKDLRIVPLTLPVGFYLKEARLDGIDVLNSHAPFSNASTLELLISSRGGRIEGTVTDDRLNLMSNVQVVLIPDAQRNRKELFQHVDTDSNGRFTMTAIAPGEYTLFAWEAIEPNAWFDPEVLAAFESMGRSIPISESSAQTVQIRMIPEGSNR